MKPMQKKIKANVVRARVDSAFKQKIADYCKKNSLEESDLIRDSLLEYLAAKEKDINTAFADVKKTMDEIAKKLDAKRNKLK